ncbi:LacI family DNA-binding transcriptional regulator [Demequina sp. SO4-18]|uniref:LacI family DNA-binding transcriptional regulator n=1 Tax=Demequina sp. SO4-18 TaxID=3401026 RepID=UPI003B5C99CA
MTKIQKVADLAGVSTATVSRALAGKPSVSPTTRARVETAARELGYVVSASASSLASGKTRNVGVVVPFFDSWFYVSVLKGIQRALADAGYDLTLYHLDPHVGEGGLTQDNPRRRRLFDEFLRRGRVDALIAVSLELDQAELDSLTDIDKPVVGIGGPLPGIQTLSLDDHQVAKLAVEHLLALGHRDIAHIAGDQDFEIDFHLPAHRRQGWESALAGAGLAAHPLLLRTADFTIAGGYDTTLQLLGDPRVRPTAIFSASDEMAIGAMLAARDLGRSVPEDLSIIGIDGHELSGFFGLTTVDQFPEVQGRHAVEILLHQLDGDRPEPGNEDLPYELVVRKSTAPPPPAALT